MAPKKKPAAKRKKTRSKVQRLIDKELPGYVVVDAARKPPKRRPVKAAKTASLDKLGSKYASGSARTKKAPKPAAGHGRIVRVRPARGGLDPAGEIGEKAVYIGPTGRVEFRQG